MKALARSCDLQARLHRPLRARPSAPGLRSAAPDRTTIPAFAARSAPCAWRFPAPALRSPACSARSFRLFSSRSRTSVSLTGSARRAPSAPPMRGGCAEPLADRCRAAVERIDQRFVPRPWQSSTRKCPANQPHAFKPGRARGMHIENAERDRQAAPPRRSPAIRSAFCGSS